MQRLMAQAYQRSARHRSLREQEADVFYRVNTGLRRAKTGDDLARAHALADNSRLWATLMDLMRDGSNALPLPVRASIISVGMAVQREAERAPPDIEFLVGINEQIAAGLAGR